MCMTFIYIMVFHNKACVQDEGVVIYLPGFTLYLIIIGIRRDLDADQPLIS